MTGANRTFTSQNRLWRRLMGFIAIGLLGLCVLFMPNWTTLRERAVVEASQTFTLSSISPGVYEWVLQDGRSARGQGIVWERSLTFKRNDLVEIRLNEGLSTGDLVQAGQQLAFLRFPLNELRLQDLQARRDAVEANRRLLAAGGRVEDVAQAQRNLDLAKGVRDGDLALLERTRKLSSEGVIPALELEAAEIQQEIRELEVSLASAAVAVARASARPEALAALDAEAAALDARMAEIDILGRSDMVACPIAGVLELGGTDRLLRVYDLSTIYLRIPIPEKDRLNVAMGDQVEFVTASAPDKLFLGQVIDLSEDASNLNGRQVFWASVEVDNPDRLLRSGMSGVARIELGNGRSVWKWLGYEILGY